MADTEVAIIGAGPYGLSLAAYLRAKKISVRVFGKPMSFWLEHMPKGMHLKSDGFASNLYDPDKSYPLRQFCYENGFPYHDTLMPVSLEIFTKYGVEFQKRFIPDLQQESVASVTKKPEGFELKLDNQEIVTAKKIVLAIGVKYFRNTPAVLEQLSPEYVTHSSDHHDLRKFAKQNVMVLGAGASAIDLAALLHDAGAVVKLIARKSNIKFHSGGGAEKRSLWKSIRHPSSGIGPGLRARFYCDAPWLFHLFPEKIRLLIVRRTLGPAGSWFMKKRFDKIPTALGSTVQQAEIKNGRVQLVLRRLDGAAIECVADRVIAATGFRIDIGRLNFLSPCIRSQIRTVENSPMLSLSMESSVPGLYFIGAAAANSFGPVMRFAFGARFAAPYLANTLAKALSSKPL